MRGSALALKEETLFVSVQSTQCILSLGLPQSEK